MALDDVAHGSSGAERLAPMRFRNWWRRIAIAFGWFIPIPATFGAYGLELGTPLTLTSIAVCWLLGVRSLRAGVDIGIEVVTARCLWHSYSLDKRDVESFSVGEAVTLRFADCVVIHSKTRGRIKCIFLDPQDPVFLDPKESEGTVLMRMRQALALVD